ncbi:hypothetical protein [Luteimicrobium subarcticum]|uniref:Ig-like domain-containing protein n=1 Tax=Luteimicrobium subarcticum TaxID=620910 RepID=A0A2M8WTJ8_9MICO|nr:hypothetical protein [Luteimicrobium subarcticum]PJI94273.1 hypothetical protein CLV34_1761 [Luteimicrobium subarcticum]
MTVARPLVRRRRTASSRGPLALVALAAGAALAVAAAVPASAAPVTTAGAVPPVAASTVAAPRITSQPASATVAVGRTATFTVRASGSALKYQWSVAAPGHASTKISGATHSYYSTVGATGRNGYHYKVSVTNSGGHVVSSWARLTVVPRPVVLTQPREETTVTSGSRVTLSVRASGTGLRYRWQYVDDTEDGDLAYHWISGATGSSYTFTARTTTPDDVRVVVSNAGGSTASDDAYVTVRSTPTDPWGPGGGGILTSWAVGLDTDVKGGATHVTGDDPTTVASTFLAFPFDVHAQTADLEFTLIAGGTSYPATATSKSYAIGTYGFVATATVPLPAADASRGVWKVTDTSGTKPVSEYFRQR